VILWEKRPVEIANLLNPAFCGEILRRCINTYQQAVSQSFPYPLIFLVLPIVLHRTTRERISPRQRLSLHAWLEMHQDLKIGFAERAEEFIPLTSEAVIFLLQVGAVTLDEQAGLTVISYKKATIEGQNEGDIADCYHKAELVGRWFARAGTAATIYAMWGVRP
jgi:ABC-three component (ABC-3C) system Middle Component 3